MKVKIKLDRDQARAIQKRFFPYLVQLCNIKIDTSNDERERLNAMLIKSVAIEVRLKFDRRLVSFANRFNISFSDCEAIVLYHLLMSLPLDSKDVWLQQLRQSLISRLYQHIYRAQAYEAGTNFVQDLPDPGQAWE